MQSTVELTSEILEKIYIHAEAAFPNECCGFLFGTDTPNRLLSIIQPVQNSRDGDQRRRFEIHPADYLRAERFAHENQTTLLGIYHSHPNHPAIASEHDLAKALPFFSYVIVSVNEGQRGEVKSWILQDEARIFSEETVQIRKNHF